jgi:hypothetical protein
VLNYPPKRMAPNFEPRLPYRPGHTFGHLVLIHSITRMDAGYDYIELIEDAIRIVERAVGKDIGFGAAQQLHSDGLLNSRNLLPLSLQTINLQPAGVI